MKRIVYLLFFLGALLTVSPAIAAPCDNLSLYDVCVVDETRQGLCLRNGPDLFCGEPANADGSCDEVVGGEIVCYHNDGEVGLCKVTVAHDEVVFGCFPPDNQMIASESDDNQCDGRRENEACTANDGRKGLCVLYRDTLLCKAPDESGDCRQHDQEVCYVDGLVGRCEEDGDINTVTYACVDPDRGGAGGCASLPTQPGSSGTMIGLLGLFFGLWRRRQG